MIKHQMKFYRILHVNESEKSQENVGDVYFTIANSELYQNKIRA